ncbi:MAG: peptide deformylase [Candidatus Aerophobetes bacterium]|nr:peptide deformylase [Candidatus Aerophobetes bacterium]
MASLYKIRKYGDPILRKKCEIVKNVGVEEEEIFERMSETMYASQGIGLAAPQVGIDKRLIVVDVGEGLLKLINPLILLGEGESVLEEGCLSLPGVTVKVKRAKSVVVEGWNEKRERIKIEGEDLFAHAIQHEVDHLQGILIIDYSDSQEMNYLIRGEKDG